MQVSVEKTSELSRKMTVNIPEEVIAEKMDARIKSLAREVKLDGFRPGKVPHQVIKKRFGQQVRGEISGDLIQSSYFEAIQEKGLNPAGPPHIHPNDTDNGFEYTAEFEVYPEVSLDGIEQIEVSRPVAEVKDVDVENMIEKLREQKKEWQSVDRAAQLEDRVTINFTGSIDGETFDGGTATDFKIELGSKQMIPGFEEELLELRAEDKKTFDIDFPEDYGNKQLAGQKAQFDIETVAVEASSLPEINADFIKAYGVEEGTMESFKADIKNNMQRELKQKVKAKLKTNVMDALNEKISIKIPEVLVDQEIENLMKPYTEQAKQQNMSLDDMNLPKEMFETQARRRVSLGLILAEIISSNELKAEPAKVREAVEEMAKSYDSPEEVVNWYYADENHLSEMEQMVLEDQTVDWLLEKVQVSDQQSDFDELMNDGQ